MFFFFFLTEIKKNDVYNIYIFTRIALDEFLEYGISGDPRARLWKRDFYFYVNIGTESNTECIGKKKKPRNYIVSTYKTGISENVIAITNVPALCW